ncbi:hypothetical protein JKF54_00155 [Wolbachia endosymbiont of Spodoptera picta]|uniref:hypothetical protein n=1 Tax=Wolbachia endosymbiont of Spodoptera picta TaxID=2769078 RepID=UPI001BABCCAD|nr:hypothetical protein [Wolbachia endosymbiont of Spodoptera picta]QUI60955.1 hypothetical protein JKF54_00155 [Wolbachia endosymbiont of Spodoptera picta]
MFFKKVNIQDFYDAKGTHVFYINVNISHALNQQQFYYYLSTNIITLDNGVGYTQMGVRMNYAKVTKRIAAYLVDQTIFLVCCSFFFLLISFILPEESLTNFFNYVFPDTDIDTELISKRYEILEDLGTLLASLVYIALEVLMINKTWLDSRKIAIWYIHKGCKHTEKHCFYASSNKKHFQDVFVCISRYL